MFRQSTDGVLGKVAELRARIRAIGAPSEHALYARQNTYAQSTVSSLLPTSARNNMSSTARLEHDSASMIRERIYSAKRL
jgi:hypothetical protein